MASGNAQWKGASLKGVPVLTLIPEEEEPCTKENSIIVELLSTPTVATSAKYKFCQRILKGSENTRTVLKWKRDGEKVIAGLAIVDQVAKRNMWKTMMTGLPATLYNGKGRTLTTAAREAAAEAAADAAAADAQRARHLNDFLTEDINEQCLQHVVTGMVPPKALQRVKRYLRRECRKPADMSVRMYYQHLTRIQLEEIPYLPPFGRRQHLGSDEMMDIILYGTPKSWQCEMDRQGYDPLTHTTVQVIAFMENLEAAEEFDPSKISNSNTKTKTKSNGKGKSHSNSSASKDSKYCLIHGHGGHSSDECHKLQAAAKKFKSGDNSSGNYSNKTWTKKASDSSKKDQKELNALIKKTKKELNALTKKKTKELNNISKKRKASEDGEFDLAALEAGLSGFNYEDMDNLKIASDEDDLKIDSDDDEIDV